MDVRVSVVIPVYNGEDYVADALESVYEQTSPPYEVIVVNDGSTDRTPQILLELETRLPATFRWITQENGGVSAARNRGVAMASGQYVAFLDHDDRWRPAKLERQLAHFASQPELSLSFTAYRFEDVGAATTKTIRFDSWDPDPRWVFDKLVEYPAVGPPSTVLVKREVLERVPPFRGGLPIGQDWLMWLYIAAAGMRCGYLAEELVDYRWHDTNASRDENRRYYEAGMMFDGFFTDKSLPRWVREKGPRCRAYWHLEAAIRASRAGERREARRHIAAAAWARPAAIRLGWSRMLGIGLPPP